MSRIIFLYSLLITLLFSPSILAHAVPTLQDPAPGATVRFPIVISMIFNAELEPEFSYFIVQDNLKQKLGKGTVDHQNTRRMIFMPAKLSAGIYQISWTAVSRDGHRRQGSYTFTVK